MSDSKCMYCGSTGSFGPGCLYGPKGIHVHPGVGAGKCIYCGSYSTGPGCLYNPNGNMHVLGIDYNMMIKETCTNGIIMSYLGYKLHSDIKTWPAFELGLIDERGNIIKKPSTIVEKACLTPMDVYVLRLKKITGERLNLIDNTIYFEQKNINNLTPKQIAESYNNELIAKDKIKLSIDDLFLKIKEAHLTGIDTKKIEQIIIESILETTNNQ